jgi:hypothetical protein
MQSADVASTCGKENLRMPIGFVTTGVCRGRYGINCFLESWFKGLSGTV